VNIGLSLAHRFLIRHYSQKLHYYFKLSLATSLSLYIYIYIACKNCVSDLSWGINQYYIVVTSEIRVLIVQEADFLRTSQRLAF
jgi:hypothetical protein